MFILVLSTKVRLCNQPKWLLRDEWRGEHIVHWFSVLDDLAEDLSSVPSTKIAVHNGMELHVQEIESLLASSVTRHGAGCPSIYMLILLANK